MMIFLRILFKILTIPVLLVFALLGLLAKSVTNLSCYVIGPFMLFLLGCCVYTIVMQLWSQLIILMVLLLGCVAILFGASWIIVFLEDTTGRLVSFISR